MDEDQTEKLIKLIHDRPALYDKRLKEYSDRSINRALWKEVCEEMLDSWNAMSVEEKILKVKEIQQRWQNIRTCFKRELNRSKWGHLSKKRRKYIYYNQLLFLLPTMEHAEKVKQTLTSGTSGNQSGLRIETTTSNIQARHMEYVRPKTCTASSYQRSILNILKKKNEKEEIDEDKCFLLSLVPSFRRLSDDQKFEAKMEFLSVIRRISQSKPCSILQDSLEVQNEREDSPQTIGKFITKIHSDSSQSSHASFNNLISSDFISEVKIE